MRRVGETGTVVDVSARDVSAVAELAARAFADDAMFTTVFPSPDQRRRRLPAFFRGAVRYGRVAGRAWTTPDKAGVTIWLAPEQPTVALPGMVRSGMVAFPLTLGPAAFRRFVAYTSWLDAQRRELVAEAHWFLLALAVDPRRQRQGVGSALMAPALADADRNGLRAYLETTSPANVDYYARTGFAVAREATPESGPRTWLMIRPPADATH
jgi:GNAT superfamily N-acetyltransferase